MKKLLPDTMDKAIEDLLNYADLVSALRSAGLSDEKIRTKPKILRELVKKIESHGYINLLKELK